MNDFGFGNYLCALREEQGLSQRELAEKLGVSDKAVSKWENGRSKPQNKTLLVLSKLFGISTDELLTGGRRKEDVSSENALSPAAFGYQSTEKRNEKDTNMNFIPKQSVPCYDYMCTWALQGAAARKLGLSSGDDCTDQRDALTDELLFGSDRYYTRMTAPTVQDFISFLTTAGTCRSAVKTAMMSNDFSAHATLIQKNSRITVKLISNV